MALKMKAALLRIARIPSPSTLGQLLESERDARATLRDARATNLDDVSTGIPVPASLIGAVGGIHDGRVRLEDRARDERSRGAPGRGRENDARLLGGTE